MLVKASEARKMQDEGEWVDDPINPGEKIWKSKYIITYRPSYVNAPAPYSDDDMCEVTRL